MQEVNHVAIVDLTIVPIGTGSTSLSAYVAAIQEKLQSESTGLHFELTAMGTIIEGDLDLILKLVRTLHEVPFDKGASRVSTTLRIDDRRDKQGSVSQKICSVANKLQGN